MTEELARAAEKTAACTLLYVSPDGNDGWSGRLPQHDGAGGGPFATPQRARDKIRTLREAGAEGQTFRVLLRGGVYPLEKPLVFTPADSAPAQYCAYPGERPVLSGGRMLTGWRIGEANGQAAWVLDVPGTAGGAWYFRELFVNGQRRSRPRLPKSGYLWMRDVPGTTLESGLYEGSDSFCCHPGDVKNWRNLTDAEVVALHYWNEERMPIASFDERTGLVKSSRRSIFALIDANKPRFAKYYVENVFEALTEPGEWYLDRASGTLYYLPMPGETPVNTEVIAPVLKQLVRFVGKPEEREYVENISLSGLTFAHADWEQPGGGWDTIRDDCRFLDSEVDYAAAPQAAVSVPGTIALRGARHCTIEGCSMRHTGLYAIELGEGCMDNVVCRNELEDLGAGGVKLKGADVYEARELRTGRNKVTDNHIHHGGCVFMSGVGVAIYEAFGNEVSHNHIHDLKYSGISCGWIWDKTECVSRDNVIARNHIHHIGDGGLNDMGGVYTLGTQPGTVIRGNVIHDVKMANYGGWGIYLDGQSSCMTVEDNVCYRTASHGLYHNGGSHNLIRNNIFAFGGEGQALYSYEDPGALLVFERNILVGDGTPMLEAGNGASFSADELECDLNAYWDVSGGEPFFASHGNTIPLDGWRKMGFDVHSAISDPSFLCIGQDDFRLNGDSPLLPLGFKAIDTDAAGPRP